MRGACGGSGGVSHGHGYSGRALTVVGGCLVVVAGRSGKNMRMRHVVGMHLLINSSFAPFGGTHGTLGRARPLLDADVMGMRDVMHALRHLDVRDERVV